MSWGTKAEVPILVETLKEPFLPPGARRRSSAPWAGSRTARRARPGGGAGHRLRQSRGREGPRGVRLRGGGRRGQGAGRFGLARARQPAGSSPRSAPPRASPPWRRSTRGRRLGSRLLDHEVVRGRPQGDQGEAVKSSRENGGERPFALSSPAWFNSFHLPARPHLSPQRSLTDDNSPLPRQSPRVAAGGIHWIAGHRPDRGARPANARRRGETASRTSLEEGEIGDPRLPDRRRQPPRHVRPEAGRADGNRGASSSRSPRSVPGLQVCEHLPRLAARADKYALVRSLAHRENNHLVATHHVLTGHPQPGAFFDKVASRDDWPCYSSALDHLRPRSDGIPSGVNLPTFLMEGPAHLAGPARRLPRAEARSLADHPRPQRAGLPHGQPAASRRGSRSTA